MHGEVTTSEWQEEGASRAASFVSCASVGVRGRFIEVACRTLPKVAMGHVARVKVAREGRVLHKTVTTITSVPSSKVHYY